MKEIAITKFCCGVCGHAYDTAKEALRCETRPVTHDDVEVGDTVRITSGDGVGELLEVKEKWIVDMHWGHYAWERYWHTVSVSGRIVGSVYNKQLTFDARKNFGR